MTLTVTHRAITQQWYRKRDTNLSFVIARQCGVLNLLDSVGDVIHRDDMPGVLKFLGIGYYVTFDLFEPTEGPR